MADRAIDVTRLTRVWSMTEDEYKNRTSDDLDEYTLFLVNNGESLDDGEQAYSDFYYGSRKISDVMIIKNYPTNEYPDNKLYIVPWEDDQGLTSPAGFNAYIKYNGTVVPVAASEGTDMVYATKEYVDAAIQEALYVDTGEEIP